MLKYFIMMVITTLLLTISSASAETMPMDKNMNNDMTHQQKTVQEYEGKMMMDGTYSKEECMNQKNMMMNKDMMQGGKTMMGKYGMMKTHMLISTITLALAWILMILGIIALWKWIKIQK
jgi:hypothetical protein